MRIKCDNKDCDWDLETEDIEAWHNVLCLRCGDSKIINNTDLALFHLYKGAKGLGLVREAKTEEDKKNAIKVDTAIFRKGED